MRISQPVCPSPPNSLEFSDTTSQCEWKGVAAYLDLILDGTRFQIITRFGKPDSSKKHGNVERLIYGTSRNHRLLLLLKQDKLTAWEDERQFE